MSLLSYQDRATSVRRPTRFGAVVDNERIERQLARAARWRYNRWPTPGTRRADIRPLPSIRVARPLPTIRHVAPRPTTCGDFWHSAVPYLIGSGLLHIACLLCLAMIFVTRDVDEPLVYLQAISPEPRPEPIERPPVMLALPSLVEDGERLVSVDVAPVVSPPEVGDPAPAVEPTARFVSRRAGPVGEMRRLVGTLGEFSSLGEESHGAEFFGIHATGSRFVFVVDCSLSMGGERWKVATRELLAALERLDDDAQFFVVLFDGESHPMFAPDLSEESLIPATRENIERLRDWLWSFRLGPYTKPMKSMRLAIRLDPDAIYLLSDGEFSDPTATYLRRHNVIHQADRLKMPGVTIHTIALHSEEGAVVLERIARENGGQYQFVPNGE